MPSSWTRASVTYMDANSRTVNKVTPGGYISTTWYDQYGNVTRALTARNRLEALKLSTTDIASDEAAAADARSTFNVYSSNGLQLLTSLGPQHTTTLADGTVVAGRDLTINTYDEGAPAGTGPYNLVTTKVTGLRYWDANGVQHDADTRTSTTAYDWTLRKPTVATVDPSGLTLKTTTAYDATTGLVTSTTTPAGGSTTNTPATTQTIYYRAGTGSGYTECDNHPEWANLACRTQPGGQAASGPELPVSVTTYDMFNQPLVMTEKTSAGVLRTTTTTYDAAERVSTVVVAGATGTGIAIPTNRNVYDPATGLLAQVQSLDANNNVIAQTTTGYDALGRVTSYTDTDGVQTTTTYDLMSRSVTIADGNGSRILSYDGGGGNRGLATQVVDTQAGTITGSYDPNGNLATENWPNSIAVTRTYNQTGAQTGISYTKTGCGQADCTLYTQNATVSASGQIAGTVSTLSTQGYGYDADSRLTTVNDTLSGQCVARTYTFNTATDRTGLTTYNPAANGTCQTTTSASNQTWTYDTADRVNTTGYTYDSLGRSTTVPATDLQNPAGGNATVTYNVNDLVASLTQAGVTNTYTLDVDNQRIRSWTDGAATTHTNHYSDTADSPSWTNEGNGTEPPR